VRLPLRHEGVAQGRQDPLHAGQSEHPVNQGVLCAKGSAGIMQHYSPARLRKPLKRVGERGAGEFREIEWDEALALATSVAGRSARATRTNSPSSPAATSHRRSPAGGRSNSAR
jgi:anaerobic selenocysteine-containing dehydrogenase